YPSGSGIAYTSDALFRTDDNGETWRAIGVPIRFGEIISNASFVGDMVTSVFLTDTRSSLLRLARTDDGGKTWSSVRVDLQGVDLWDADLNSIEGSMGSDGNGL